MNDSSARAPIAPRSLFLPCALLLCLQAHAATGRWQPHAEIRNAAAEAVRSAAADTTGAIEVLADSPDPRLQLPRCEEPLKATLPAGARLSGRLTVEVRCTGNRPWGLYLPVQIESSRPVVVAARSLTRDTILAPGDVRVAKLGPGVSGYGTLGDPAQVLGQRLRRSLEAGAPVTAALLDAPLLVRRGQQVTLEAMAGNFAVRVAGVAQADGALGQLIEVRNGSSGKIVQAVVRSERTAEVLLR
ncbi:MAG: flagellar basal body P-ring formation chaperone FlgA [Gammaproteobacteria bacterium]